MGGGTKFFGVANVDIETGIIGLLLDRSKG